MADERAVHYDPQRNSSPGQTGRRSSFLPSPGSRFPLFFLFLFSFLCVFGPFPTVSSSSTLLAPHYFEYKLRKKRNSELWPFLQPKTIGHASSSQGQNEMKREKRREEKKKKRREREFLASCQSPPSGVGSAINAAFQRLFVISLTLSGVSDRWLPDIRCPSFSLTHSFVIQSVG